MGRFMRIGGSLAIAIAIAAPASGAARRDHGGAASLCVGRQPGCYGTIQAAVDAAPDGRQSRSGPERSPGASLIAKSLTLRGAAAAATVISGGGPVLTIGVADAATEPTVTLRGVTITGGLNTASYDLGSGILEAASPSHPPPPVSAQRSRFRTASSRATGQLRHRRFRLRCVPVRGSERRRHRQLRLDDPGTRARLKQRSRLRSHERC